eukprot:2853271-Rhodomonas_salina.1
MATLCTVGYGDIFAVGNAVSRVWRGVAACGASCVSVNWAQWGGLEVGGVGVGMRGYAQGGVVTHTHRRVDSVLTQGCCRCTGALLCAVHDADGRVGVCDHRVQHVGAGLEHAVTREPGSGGDGERC